MLADFKLALKVPWCLLLALLKIISTPKMALLSSIPSLFGFVLFALLSYLTIINKNLLLGLTGIDANAWYAVVASWLLALLTVFLSALLVFILINLLLGFVVEAIVRLFIIANPTFSKQSIAPSGFILSLTRTALAESVLLTVFAALTILALLLSFFPPLALLALCISSILGGFALCSVALALANFNFRARLKFPFRWPFTCLALGLAFSAVLVLPFIGVLLLPVFYGAATLLVGETLGNVVNRDARKVKISQIP